MNKYNNKIEFSVRCILQKGNKILVCKMLKKGYYFFPGGHVEFQENVSKALKREMREELGLIVKRARLIGLVENIYKEDKVDHHEINFIYQITSDRNIVSSLEKHIKFEFLSWRQFNKTKVYPINLQRALKKWRKDKKLFIVI